MSRIVEGITSRNTAALTFNNRGHDVVARVRRGKKSVLAGAAHEVFTDCIDDIQGAVNFARRRGAREIYLVGHSTGCQKSIYWAAKGGRGVNGIILLAPVSDFAAEMKRSGRAKIARATKVARALVARGKRHELLPPRVWKETLDAQRLLSLYTPDSVEEIFSYGQPNKNPKVLRRVKIPILVLWAERDEYSSQPAKKTLAWFSGNLASPKSSIVLIPKAKHNFKGAERRAERAIQNWLRPLE